MKLMTKIIAISVMVLLGTVHGKTPPAKPDSVTCLDMEPGIWHTDMLLKFIGGWVENSHLAQADSLFQQALNYQENAKRTFEEGNCVWGLIQSFLAREAAHKAAKVCFGEEGFCIGIGLALERTQEALIFLAGLIRSCDNDLAHDFLEAALILQRKSRPAFQRNQCTQVLDLTLISRKFLYQAAYLCGQEARLLAAFPDLERPMPNNFSAPDTQDSIPGFSMQNSPNPFNDRTVISYTLPSDAKVTLTIYNVRGQKVKTLVDEFQNAGAKRVIWEGTNKNNDKVASGVYFYRLEAGNIKATKRMVLVK